jgi:hypothetical protein
MGNRRRDFPITARERSAVARLKVGFRDLRDHVSVEHFSLVAGTDIAPLLLQFTGDLCGALPWGYVIEGGLSVTCSDGTTDTIEPGDVFYVSGRQSVRVEQDSELLMLIPRRWHNQVLPSVQMRMNRYRH